MLTYLKNDYKHYFNMKRTIRKQSNIPGENIYINTNNNTQHKFKKLGINFQ